MISVPRFTHRPRLILVMCLAFVGLGAVLTTHVLGALKAGGTNEARAEPAPSQQRAAGPAGQHQTVLIRAEVREVRKVLLQVKQIAEWNPAFLTIAGPAIARIGEPHPIRVRGGLSGQFQYDLIDPDRIESSWRVPGFRETNYWTLQAADGHNTMVTHGFTQSGSLAKLLRGATRGVAELRVARLKTRVEAP